MQAHVEYITGGIVRVGAGKPPEPYRYSVTYDDHSVFAVIKGFSTKHISRAEYECIIRTINAASGKLVRYYRTGRGMHCLTQIDPTLTKGRIVMRKEPIPHVDTAKTSGGIDHEILLREAEKAIEQIKSGHYQIVDVGQDELPGGDVRLWFIRREF